MHLHFLQLATVEKQRHAAAAAAAASAARAAACLGVSAARPLVAVVSPAGRMRLALASSCVRLLSRRETDERILDNGFSLRGFLVLL